MLWQCLFHRILESQLYGGRRDRQMCAITHMKARHNHLAITMLTHSIKLSLLVLSAHTQTPGFVIPPSQSKWTVLMFLRQVRRAFVLTHNTVTTNINGPHMFIPYQCQHSGLDPTYTDDQRSSYQIGCTSRSTCQI